MANIDERIKQCDAGIAALEEQRQQLLDKKEEQKPLKPGDVVIYPTMDTKRLIVGINGEIYAVDTDGYFMAKKKEFKDLGYKKIGTCTGFTTT